MLLTLWFCFQLSEVMTWNFTRVNCSTQQAFIFFWFTAEPKKLVKWAVWINSKLMMSTHYKTQDLWLIIRLLSTIPYHFLLFVGPSRLGRNNLLFIHPLSLSLPIINIGKVVAGIRMGHHVTFLSSARGFNWSRLESVQHKCFPREVSITQVSSISTENRLNMCITAFCNMILEGYYIYITT